MTDTVHSVLDGGVDAVLTATVTDLAEAGMAVVTACALVGLPRASYYRRSRGYRHYQPVTDPVPHRDRVQPAALTDTERAAVVDTLCRDEYTNLSVVQTYWHAFDAGQVGCSQRSFYRVATAAGLVGDRRRTRRHGIGGGQRRHGKPVVAAAKPGDLWSWDITDLRGPGRHDVYKLYLAIDVFSRDPVAWRIEYRESDRLAVEMFAAAIIEHGVPDALHADNGSVMRSHLMLDALEEAGVLASFSRPRVSDDNPFSESLFKTIKYDLDCPDRFDSIDHARDWTRSYLDRYSTQHRHSGLGFYTPSSVRDGTAVRVQQARQDSLDRYWEQHPERFRRPPKAPQLPQPTGINTPKPPRKLSQTC